MVTRIITNHIKPGTKAEYIAASKAFCAALVERNGCLEARVYDVPDRDDVVNIEVWPDRETAEAVTATPTFAEFLPELGKYFLGSEGVFLNLV